MVDNKEGCILQYVLIGAVLFVLIKCALDKREKFALNNRTVRYSNTPDYSTNSFTDQLWVGRFSDDCYSRSVKGCTKYANCGLCIKNGKPECVPGDENGPLFRGGCDKWGYGDYYGSSVYGNKYDTNRYGDYYGSRIRGQYYGNLKKRCNYIESRPWDHFYPDYEVWHPMPTNRVLY